ncbi:MAG: aromatic ring-hydroxylating dioxygenase subunit alpha, partial [Ilumatobacteraceae bacterium]
PIVVLRGDDGEVRALHNVCRHRGSIVCDAAAGHAGRRLVCPYHQWSYRLDGHFAGGRDVAVEVDREALAMGAAHCTTVGGLVFVCVATDPPDPAFLRDLVEPYLAPFNLDHAVVAHQETVVEHGNWKLVMENNRECHHCRLAHPELCTTFPQGTMHSGGGSAEERQRLDELVAVAEAAGLPSRLAADDRQQYRVMRMPLEAGTRSMTLDGAPAVDRRFGRLPDLDLGDLLLYHYPSTWNHFMADHAVTFRMLPLGPTSTELRTTWLVPPNGAGSTHSDDLDRLTAVWTATNRQDTALVERAQRGIASPAYRPGPYAPTDEDGVIQFVDWYVGTLLTRAGKPAR